MIELTENIVSNIKNRLTGKRAKTLAKVQDKGDNALGDRLRQLNASTKALLTTINPEKTQKDRKAAKLDVKNAEIKANRSANWRERSLNPSKMSKFMTKAPVKEEVMEENRWPYIRSLLETQDDVHAWTKPQKIRIRYFDDKKGDHVWVDHTLHPPKWKSDTKPRLYPETADKMAREHLRSLGIKAKINKMEYVKEEAGAGEIGTSRLVQKYKKDTPGQ